MTRLISVLLLLAALLPATAGAHSLGLSLLKLNQTGDQRYSVAWQPSPALARLQRDHSLSFPEGCRLDSPVLTCDNGLTGEIRIAELPPHAEVVLHLTTASGEQYRVMRDGRATVAEGATPALMETIGHYGVIGVEHILLGVDHLLFVVGLVLLVGFNRGLIWAITAFTVSHSITLILSMLDLVRVPIGPVEVVIALSIVLVIREAMAGRQTLSRRLPWLVAFGFGLIHGLGFASALGDIGLPASQELAALVAFNLGVEAGQLMALAVIWIAVWAFRGLKLPRAPERAARLTTCYLAGTAATYWTLERAWGVFA